VSGRATVLSATLIVRDEERVLGPCLASLRSLVDEIIVVDTGSSDRSAELAIEHGAKVFHFAWCDDFSAARNFAIEQASCPWLLYIDADERVRDGDHAAVRASLSTAQGVAGRVRFHPRTGFTAYREYRLYRRDPRVRFEGVVHESMLPAVGRLIAAEGARIVETDLTIDHVGYDGPQTHKSDRYLRLLTQATRQDPERIYLWWHLGCVHRDLGQIDEAETFWRRGAALALAKRPQNGDACLCHIELINLELARDHDPTTLIEEGRHLRPDNFLLQRFEAISLMRHGHFAKAARLFAGLAEIDPETVVAENAYDKRIFGTATAKNVAECAFRAGDYGAAAQWYGVAERGSPDAAEFRTKRLLAEIYERRGGRLPALS
jgi:glycosyltransferase involved in cell wall biosynthesis